MNVVASGKKIASEGLPQDLSKALSSNERPCAPRSLQRVLQSANAADTSCILKACVAEMPNSP
jgi:hypothetical protein